MDTRGKRLGLTLCVGKKGCACTWAVMTSEQSLKHEAVSIASGLDGSPISCALHRIENKKAPEEALVCA
jgi:hypothetical protein